MLERILSGGQSGADQAGWRAAKAAGIATGGAMPLAFLTEDGPWPDFAELYGAHQIDSADYPARTKATVKAADGTLWFGSPHTPGYHCTSEWTFKTGKPFLVVPAEGTQVRPSQVARWIDLRNIKVLNIAGNRESKAPGGWARLRVSASARRCSTTTSCPRARRRRRKRERGEWARKTADGGGVRDLARTPRRQHPSLDRPRTARENAPDAILINTCRGPVVDVPAVARALDAKRLWVYGADVYTVEPPRSGHPLTGRPDVMLTPHSAAQTSESLRNWPWARSTT
jgi:hypothetical protein